MRKRLLSLFVAMVASMALLAGPAQADPKNAFGPIPINCGGWEFEITVHGNGDWTAAHLVDSNAVLVVSGFRNGWFRYTDPDGNVEEDFDAPETKGSGKQKGQWCTWAFDFSTGNGQERFEGGGEAFVKVTPGKSK